MQLNDNQKRWIVVGIALHTIIVPELRPFVEKAVKYLHKKETVLHQQTCRSKLKTWYGYKLEYKNINNNDKVVPQPPKPIKELYNYNVSCAVDYAKLYLQPHMAKFTAFSEADASALLGIIINLKAPQFRPLMEKGATVSGIAGRMRNLRNEWAHCKFTDWNENTFLTSFLRMNKLISIIVPTHDLQRVEDRLEELEQKGIE